MGDRGTRFATRANHANTLNEPTQQFVHRRGPTSHHAEVSLAASADICWKEMSPHPLRMAIAYRLAILVFWMTQLRNERLKHQNKRYL